MYNVKDFLEDGVYYAPDAKVKEMPKNPECITMHRKSGNEFIIISSVKSRLKIKDWMVHLCAYS